MKDIIVFLFSIIFLLGCQDDPIEPASNYDCQFNSDTINEQHPKANVYQKILDENQKDGLVGAVLLVKDQNGFWVGASGEADIASDVDMKPCNTFLIASISKVFTAAAVFKYIDKGIIKLDDPINKWIGRSVTDKVDNANEATIQHLLSHTSGIRDYYTNQFELHRVNQISNGWSKEEVLEYVYNKPAKYEVGETYQYSNTNYLLLSMILERASGLSFEEIYQQEIFDPLNLASAYYSETQPIPDGTVKGYADRYGTGRKVVGESAHLYGDELGIGGDGGIAVNAYDLAVFLESLMKGQLVSENSLNEMTNWFDLPVDWHWDTYGQTENGYGLEKFNTPYGYAVGHTGGIDGFATLGFYFPKEDMTYILFVNSTIAFSGAPKKQIFERTLEQMFE